MEKVCPPENQATVFDNASTNVDAWKKNKKFIFPLTLWVFDMPNSNQFDILSKRIFFSDLSPHI